MYDENGKSVQIRKVEPLYKSRLENTTFSFIKMSLPPTPGSAVDPEPVVCQVVDPNTMHYLIFEDLLNNPIWERVTHVLLVDWLWFPQAPPAQFMDNAKAPFSALTLTPALWSWQRAQPHLHFIWAFPSPTGKWHLHARVARYGVLYLESLTHLLSPYPCDGFQMETELIELLSHSYRGFDELRSLLTKTSGALWIAVSHQSPPSPVMQHFQQLFLVDLYLIKSFGYIRYGPVHVTSHGMFFPTEPLPDNTMADTGKTMQHVQVDWQVPLSRMVLWMDTSGLDYTLHQGDVVKFTTISLKDINRLRYVATDTPLPNSGVLRFDDRLIYYDSPAQQRAKLALADTMRGFVMGPMDKDVCFKHPASLLYQAQP